MILSTLHSVAGGLVRRSWLVALVTLAICGGFAAHALAALRAPAEPAPPPIIRAPAAPVVPDRPVADPDGLVARNMFCSICTPTVATPGGPTTTFVPEATLIATSVGASSHATVRVTRSEAQGSWALGDAIPGLGTIDRIGYASIDVIDGDGRKGTLSLLEAAASQKPGAATPVALAAAASPFDDRVKRLDDHTYEVDRALVRELVAGAAGGKGGIRAVPILKNGELDGLRLVAVKSGSAPAAIGLKSHDILSAIDGTPIKSAQQMIDLYGKLDQLSVVELQGTRAGKPLRVTLNLR